MKCRGCDGHGTYQLLGPVQVCDRCQGSCVEPEYDIEQKPLHRIGVTVQTHTSDSELPDEIPREMLFNKPQQDQLARLHTTPQDQLADAIRGLQDPLPQIVFEVLGDAETERMCSSKAWWWNSPFDSEWDTDQDWIIVGTLATPGPEPAP